MNRESKNGFGIKEDEPCPCASGHRNLWVVGYSCSPWGLTRGLHKVLLEWPMFSLCSSYGFPMLFLCLPYAVSLLSQCFIYVFPYAFPTVPSFPVVSLCAPPAMFPLWFPYDSLYFPILLLWFPFVFPMCPWPSPSPLSTPLPGKEFPPPRCGIFECQLIDQWKVN